MKIALITGTTGLVGKNLVYSLLQNSAYDKVYALVRKELSIKDDKLIQVVFNFDKEEDYQSLPIGHDVFCCLGTTIKKAGSQAAFRKVDLEYPTKLAQYCADKGYSSYSIITALGSDINSSLFYNRVKGEVEEKVKAFNFNSIHILRPSLLLGDRAEFRIGERIAHYFFKGFSFLFIGSLKKYKGIEGITVARAMVNLANTNEKGIFIHESDNIQVLGQRKE